MNKLIIVLAFISVCFFSSSFMYAQFYTPESIISGLYPGFKTDRQMLQIAIKEEPHAFKFLDDSLKRNKEFVHECVRTNG